MGTCGLHTAHNAFKHGEKASEWQLKKHVIYEQNLPLNTWKVCWLQNCYWCYREELSRAICYSLLGGKWCSCKKPKLIWSKIFEVVSSWQQLPGLQTTLVRKTRSQHQLWSFMQSCERCVLFQSSFFFSGSSQKITWTCSLLNWEDCGTISYGNIGRSH